MGRIRKFTLILIIFMLGFLTGGYVFSDSLPRSFLAADKCRQTDCLDSNEFLGLLGSVGLQRFKKQIPDIVYETDKSVVLDAKRLYKYDKLHYVIVPKKDITDIAHLTYEDKAYLADAHAVIGQIVRDNNMQKYQVITNGPAYQFVRYLHFHLISED